jgi:hypothetical protein
MRLALRRQSYDLTTRALVVAGHAPTPVGVPLCAVAADDQSVDAALAAGADLVRLLAPTTAAYGACAAAEVAVIVPADTGIAEARAAGLPPEAIVPDAVFLDVTGLPCQLSATVVGVLRGARVVRTDGVEAARRVCDVLAAIMEAGDR